MAKLTVYRCDRCNEMFEDIEGAKVEVTFEPWYNTPMDFCKKCVGEFEHLGHKLFDIWFNEWSTTARINNVLDYYCGENCEGDFKKDKEKDILAAGAMVSGAAISPSVVAASMKDVKIAQAELKPKCSDDAIEKIELRSDGGLDLRMVRKYLMDIKSTNIIEDCYEVHNKRENFIGCSGCSNYEKCHAYGKCNKFPGGYNTMVQNARGGKKPKAKNQSLWEGWEIDLLKEEGPNNTLKELGLLFDHRSIESIKKKCIKLGVSYKKGKPGRPKGIRRS